MHAVITKYHPPTNFRCARISARVADRRAVFVPYPVSDMTNEDAHRVALAAYLKRQSWLSPAEKNPANWRGEWTADGYAFVFVDPKETQDVQHE